MIVEYKNEGRDLPALLKQHANYTNWLTGDNFDSFERAAALAGPCTIFKFAEGRRSLFIVHCHNSEAILVVSRTVKDAKNRCTALNPINLGHGAPRYMAFEYLTRYLKNLGWLTWNPRLYAHLPLAIFATDMQADYGAHIEKLDAEDYAPRIYFGDTPPTAKQVIGRLGECLKLYTLTHD